jgi:putative redox protein
MATGSSHRAITIDRDASCRYTARNERGGIIAIGTSADTDFTPTELLLAAIGACTAIDVDVLTTRRSAPDSFEVKVGAESRRDSGGNHLGDITVTFRLRFPETPGGDQARAILPDAVRKSHDRLCTVGLTVQRGTPIATRIV